MYQIGDHVEHQGNRAIITGLSGNSPQSYHLRYLARPPVPQGRQARAEELEALPPIGFEVGQQVSIAGIRGQVIEQLPDGQYKVQAETGDQRGKGYAHSSEWTLQGWRLALTS